MKKREANFTMSFSEDSAVQKRIELKLKELEDGLFQPSVKIRDLITGLEADIKMPKGDFRKVFEKMESQLTPENTQKISQKIATLFRYI